MDQKAKLGFEPQSVHTHDKLKEYELLLTLTLGITTSKGFGEALAFTLKNLCERTNWECAEAWLCDNKAKQTLCMATYYNINKPELVSFTKYSEKLLLDKNVSLPGQAWQKKHAVWVEDLLREASFQRKEQAKLAGLGTALCIPIPLNGEVIAVLCLYQQGVKQVDQSMINLITAVAGELGLLVKQKQTEEMLKETGLQFNSLIEASPDAIVLTNEIREIILWNKGAEQIFGYSLDSALQLHIDDLLCPSNRATLVHAVENCLSSFHERGIIAEFIALTKEGNEFPIEMSITCWKAQNKAQLGFIIRDISTRIEEAQKLKNEISLRSKNELMLKEHANKLDAKNKELEQFAYVASHDLQEPLRMVSSYTQLLAKKYGGQLDADAQTFIKYAVEGAQRMQAMINDLLQFSRVGTKEKDFHMLEFKEIVETALNNLELTIEELDAEIRCSKLPLIRGDKGLLVQLMQNLLSNALKFRKKHETPVVKISANEEEESWILSVEDNGIGIAQHQIARDRLFKIFQRLHTREEYPGTGIGLAICQKIVEAHNGTIWINSQEDIGTRVSFKLPK